MSTVSVRRGEPSESDELSALALRSKAYWGYDTAFLELCRAELTLTAEDVSSGRVSVAERDGRVVGFYGLLGDPPEADLAYLFVEPDVIGTGVGRRLWNHAVATAVALEFECIRVEADPYAESFYRAMGAEPVGWAASNSVAGRRLPVLRFRMSPVASGPERARSRAPTRLSPRPLGTARSWRACWRRMQ